MHDTADLEARGSPSVYVATVEFRDGGERQARSLGADVASVFVEHPIQDRTDAEMQAIADGAAEEICAALLGASGAAG